MPQRDVAAHLSLMLYASSSSDSSKFADLAVSPAAWAVLGVSVFVLIAFDLWRHRDDHEPSMKEATKESLFYVLTAIAFGVGVMAAWGSAAATEYFSGYVIEKSLSVDNVFVWSMLFGAFAIPKRYQHRVLFWGIFGALVLRAIFVFAGSAMIEKFWWTLFVFGMVLLFSGVKVLRHRDNEDSPDGHQKMMSRIEKFVPVTDRYDGHKFFTKIDGKRAATPLLAALIAVELTDIVFAVDSVPAILAVSREPYIVIASNAFAILGLRALYFLLADAKERFHYLSHALGAVLMFVGAKMIVSHWWHMPTVASLVVIVTLLVFAVAASVLKTRRSASS